MPSIAASHVAGEPIPDGVGQCQPAGPLLIRELSIRPIERVAFAFLHPNRGDDRSCRPSGLDHIRFLLEQNLD